MSDAPREMSPEEYRQMIATSGAPKDPHNYNKYLPTAALVIVSLIIGFAVGANYQKGKGSTTNTAATGSNGQSRFGRGYGMRRSGGLGTVTSVSDSSITINNQRSGSSQTFKITSSTTVSNNGASASVSDIKSGDTVLIRASGTDTSTATTIDLNPSFGGGTGMNQTPSSGTTDNSTNSTSSPVTDNTDTTTQAT